MTSLKKIAIASGLLCGCLTIGASAQTVDYNPSWYVAPSVNALDVDQGVFGVNRDGAGAGLRFGKPISSMWDIQFGTTYARANQNGVGYRQNLLGADALLMLSRKQFRPFLLMGLGAQYDRVSSSMGSASGTSPYLNAGLGFQLSFNDQWAMQADVRRVHGFLQGNTFGTHDTSRNNYLTIGLNYSFNPPPAPAPVQVAEPAPIAEPAPAPEPVAAPKPVFERVTLSSTELFGFDSAKLRMPQPKLDQIADVLNKHPEVTNVAINGYADRLGRDAYNQKLSQQRADAVKNYLVSKNVDGSRLAATGKGEADPVEACDGVKKRAALIKCLEPNRRVEVEDITVQRRVQ